MNTLFRRIVLAVTVILAAFVGIWAAVFPESFYTSFPGFGLGWIREDGAYDEHLIRDVGGLDFGYHLFHPEGTTLDRIGTVVSLALSLALGLVLVLPSRKRVAIEAQVTR